MLLNHYVTHCTIFCCVLIFSFVVTEIEPMRKGRVVEDVYMENHQIAKVVCTVLNSVTTQMKTKH